MLNILENDSNEIELIHFDDKKDDNIEYSISISNSSKDDIKDIVMSELDDYIQAYNVKYKNINLPKIQFIPNINMLDFGKRFKLSDFDGDIVIILKKFNSLGLYDQRTSKLNINRYVLKKMRFQGYCGSIRNHIFTNPESQFHKINRITFSKNKYIGTTISQNK